MKIFGLNADEILITRPKCITDGVDNGRFPGVVASYESGHAGAKIDLKFPEALTEKTEISDSKLRKEHPCTAIHLY